MKLKKFLKAAGSQRIVVNEEVVRETCLMGESVCDECAYGDWEECDQKWRVMESVKVYEGVSGDCPMGLADHVVTGVGVGEFEGKRRRGAVLVVRVRDPKIGDK